MGCFCGRLMSAASDQKLFCKLCSPFCCSFDEFVEDKVISPSYSSAILTPLPLYSCLGASLVDQMVKCLPAMWETQAQSLGQEDPLEKEMATHSSTLAWKIPWTEVPGRLQSMGSQRVKHD